MPASARGFSLIELVVVMGIFTLISVIVLANYPAFNHKVSIQNLAHQIGLEIRQAQVFGLSVKESAAGSGTFRGYGVYFSAADSGSFIFYTDINNNKKYDYAAQSCSSPSNTECLEKINIASGDSLKNICAVRSTGVRDCAVPESGGGLEYLNIVFVRPDPDANILGTYASADALYQKAEISIEPPKKDFYKTVVVWTTGQISIE